MTFASSSSLAVPVRALAFIGLGVTVDAPARRSPLALVGVSRRARPGALARLRSSHVLSVVSLLMSAAVLFISASIPVPVSNPLFAGGSYRYRCTTSTTAGSPQEFSFSPANAGLAQACNAKEVLVPGI